MASTARNSKEMLSSLTLLSGFVRQSALLQNELEEGRDGQAKAESERDYGAALQQVISAERFPHLSQVLASGPLGDDPSNDDNPDRDFVDGLELILDGLSVRITAATRSPNADRD